mmetsp:Transcript_38799/g.77653  ORF Transcript_38799/g.77653 Transcript_38799/m.77653 type:complete len:91 (+) Transcript_38799:2-274(+)
MSISAEELLEKLKASDLEPSYVTVVDDSDGCGSKFKAVVVSPKFDGVALLERQRMVNAIIAEEMNSIHAFEMKTWTPAQYEKKRGELAAS